jgi:hypothetical protein
MARSLVEVRAVCLGITPFIRRVIATDPPSSGFVRQVVGKARSNQTRDASLLVTA